MRLSHPFIITTLYWLLRHSPSLNQKTSTFLIMQKHIAKTITYQAFLELPVTVEASIYEGEGESLHPASNDPSELTVEKVTLRDPEILKNLSIGDMEYLEGEGWKAIGGRP